MTLSQQRAICSLTARASHTGTNTSGSAVIGDENTLEFPDANIDYSFKVTATGSGDVATLTLSTGVVAQTTGTPTITDGDGKDFEGVTLGTMATLYAVLIVFGNNLSGACTVAASSAELPDYEAETDGELLEVIKPNGIASPGTIAFTLASAGDSVTVTVIGKTA